MLQVHLTGSRAELSIRSRSTAGGSHRRGCGLRDARGPSGVARAASCTTPGSTSRVRRPIDGREERRTYSIVTPPGAVGAAASGFASRRAGACRASSRTRLSRRRHGSRWALPWGGFAPRWMRRAPAPMSRSPRAAASRRCCRWPTDILAREPHSRFTLIYGNRNMARTMFLEDTLALKNRYLGRFSRVFRDEPRAAARSAPQRPHRCGQGRGARARDSPTSRARTSTSSADPAAWSMRCASAMQTAERQARRCVSSASPPRRAPRRAGGRRRHAANAVRAPPRRECWPRSRWSWTGGAEAFPWRPTDASVLEAAERAGLELPFSCRSGICATCRTKIVAGEAVMAHNIALEPWEVDGRLHALLPGASPDRLAGADL